MSQSPFYLEHYLDSLETLPGELRKNFTKMTDKDVMNKDIMVQIDGASDEYLRKVRDLSPTKRKAEMEKIQVRQISALGEFFRVWLVVVVVVMLVIGLSKEIPGGNGDPHTPSQLPNVNISQQWLHYLPLALVSHHFFSILQSSAAIPPLFLSSRALLNG